MLEKEGEMHSNMWFNTKVKVKWIFVCYKVLLISIVYSENSVTDTILSIILRLESLLRICNHFSPKLNSVLLSSIL